MIYLLFGEMGCGKSHLGEELAYHLKCPFYDGDDALPAKLQAKVSSAQLLNMDEVDLFIKNNFIPLLKKVSINSQDIVVSQALYTHKHRQMIKNRFYPSLRWVEVYAPFKTQMKRLYSRRDGWKWCLNALLSKPWYEPMKTSFAINNVEDFTLSKEMVKVIMKDNK